MFGLSRSNDKFEYSNSADTGRALPITSTEGDCTENIKKYVFDAFRDAATELSSHATFKMYPSQHGSPRMILTVQEDGSYADFVVRVQEPSALSLIAQAFKSPLKVKAAEVIINAVTKDGILAPLSENFSLRDTNNADTPNPGATRAVAWMRLNGQKKSVPIF